MATLIIPERICPHCGGNKWSIDYDLRPIKKDPQRRVMRYRCANRMEERRKRWDNNHPDYNEATRLTDSYIKKNIVRGQKVFKRTDIPNELLQLKKQSIILKRQLKLQYGKENHSNQG